MGNDQAPKGRKKRYDTDSVGTTESRTLHQIENCPNRCYLSESKRETPEVLLRETVGRERRRKTEHQKRADRFLSQVFPPSALLQISLLLVETTISAGLPTSPRISSFRISM